MEIEKVIKKDEIKTTMTEIIRTKEFEQVSNSKTLNIEIIVGKNSNVQISDVLSIVNSIKDRLSDDINVEFNLSVDDEINLLPDSMKMILSKTDKKEKEPHQ